MDLVLGPFADAHIETLSLVDLDRLEQLMGEEDPELLTWVMGQAVPPDTVDRAFLEILVADHKARVSK